MKKLRIALLAWTSALVVGWIIGQVFRDTNRFTALGFYVPSPALVFFLVVSALAQAWAKQRRSALLSLAISIAPVVSIAVVENHWSTPERPTVTNSPQSLRLVHWNIASGRIDWAGVRETLVEKEADIYLITETPPSEDPTRALSDLLHALGPGYTMKEYDDFAVLARGDLEIGDDWAYRDHKALVRKVTWTPNGLKAKPVNILFADMPASPANARDPLLRALCRTAVEHDADLIVGDLNAPRRSLALSDLPPGFRHAYHTVGRGLGYTWPVPLPMYSLDHCIHGRRVEPRRYDLVTTWSSDHRLQLFEFAVEP